MRIGYDPIGSWKPLDPSDWPKGEEGPNRSCTDAIIALMSNHTVTFDGAFPKWATDREGGNMRIGNLTVPVVYAHDLGAGSSVRPPERGFVFPDGSNFLWADFYTDHTLRIGTELPGTNYCWHWFEQAR